MPDFYKIHKHRFNIDYPQEKIDGELYIANGKYGPYCYYKTAVMNKASFVSLKYYQGDYMNDEANNIYRFVKEQIQKPKAQRIKKNYK